MHILLIPDITVITWFLLGLIDNFDLKEHYISFIFLTLIWIMLIGKYLFYYHRFELYRNEKQRIWIFESKEKEDLYLQRRLGLILTINNGG